ncbi:helix-turn-helix transcriptional regulator [Deinococcus sp. D7000]|nr:helix-turn-helix transcriptional regulator [Deinococcus sp. D7000]
MPETIGQRIRAARIAAGLSVRGLAKIALGGKQNARQVSGWESGEVTPSLSSLSKIAPCLNLSVSELIGDSPRTHAA